MREPSMAERLEISAILDRIMFGSDETFSVPAARRLHSLVPARLRGRKEIAMRGSGPGGSSAGFGAPACGVAASAASLNRPAISRSPLFAYHST